MSLASGKISQGQGQRLLDFSAEREAPILGIELARLVQVSADEEVRYGREPGVEVLDRAFEIDEAEGAKNHAVFAGNLDGLSLGESPGQDGGSRTGHHRRS